MERRRSALRQVRPGAAHPAAAGVIDRLLRLYLLCVVMYALLYARLVVTEGLQATPAALLTLCSVVGLALLPWLPRVGTVLVLVAPLVGPTVAGPSPIETFPLAALFLTARRSRGRWLALAGLIGVYGVNALGLAERSEWILFVAVLTAFVTIGVLLGAAVRRGLLVIEKTQSAVEREAWAAQDARQRARLELAGEIAEATRGALEAPHSAPAAAADDATGSDAAASRRALAREAEAARSALQQLRAVILALREPGGDAALSPDPPPLRTGRPAAPTLSASFEALEDALAGSGIPVAVPEGPLPALPAATITAVDAGLQAVSADVLGRGAAGEQVDLRFEAPDAGYPVTVSVSYRVDEALAGDPPGPAPLAARLALTGGTLTLREDAGRREVRITVPRDAQGAAIVQEDEDEPPLPLWGPGMRRILLGVPLGFALVLMSLEPALRLLAPLPGTDPQPLADGASLIGAAGVLIALWRPRIGAAIAVAALAVQLATHASISSEALIPVGLLAIALTHLRGIRLALAAAAFVAYVLVRAFTIADVPWDRYLETQFVLIIPVIALLGLIDVVRLSHEARAARLLELRAQRARVRDRERQALAGDLHDILAHHLSLLVLEAREHEDSENPAVLQAALAHARERREAAAVDLAMLAQILSSGRSADDAAQAERPDTQRASAQGEDAALAPTSADIPLAAQALADVIRARGFTPQLSVAGELASVPLPVRRTLVRVLREGTTNALRYAPAASPIRLSVSTPRDTAGAASGRSARASGRAVRAEVRSDLPAGDVRDRSGLSSGTGLRGLRERAVLQGGTLTAGPVDGQWLLTVTLPVSGVPEAP